LNDTNSYVCQIYTDCIWIGCAKNGTCMGVQAPLDGSFCGANKICLNFECVEEKPSELINSNIKNQCPGGVNQEISFFNSPIVFFSYFSYEFLKESKSCENYLSNSSLTNRQIIRIDVCEDGYLTPLVCCERCIMFRLNNCNNNLPCTCESFKNSNPCFNNGKCTTIKSRIGSSVYNTAFKCICKTGYKGLEVILKFCKKTKINAHFYDLKRTLVLRRRSMHIASL
jgi:hypothetical protein